MPKRLYGRRWGKARRAHLARQPLCVMCQQEGRTTAAEVVDHITPHRDDPELFWNPDNWQSLCKRHHDSTKQRIEKSGKALRRVGLDGYPIGRGGSDF